MKSNKSTLHFIYSVPRPARFSCLYLIEKALNILRLPPLYRHANFAFIPWRDPVRAPHSISQQLLKEFKKNWKVKYYSLYEHNEIRLGEKDIVIGVPSQDNKDPWGKPDKEAILYRTLQKYPNHQNKFILMPFSSDGHYINWANDFIEKNGKNLLLIGGRIWYENWDRCPWASFPVKNKIRLDMGIDAEMYPRLKTTFNKPGQRGFLYIGHDSWYKNKDMLEKLATSLPQYRFGHIGLGSIKGWKKISDFADLNSGFMTGIAKDYDFHINVSTADPQATTILEMACFGFPIACTPESGHNLPSSYELNTTDLEHNIRILNLLQSEKEESFLKRSALNAEYIRENHNWENFTSTVIAFIKQNAA